MGELWWAIANSFLMETFMLFLLAIGFFLIHRTAKFLNIAHPDYATLGAFLVWTLVSVAGTNIWIAVLVSVIASGVFAVFVDQVTYKYIRGAPLALLLCSVGVSFVMRYGILMIWGAGFRKIIFPLPSVHTLGTVISGSLIFAIASGSLIILVAYLLLERTALGTSARAVADNPSLAENFGINTERTLKFIFFLSGCTAALGGVVIALYQPLGYGMGFSWILLILAVSILAGTKINLPRLLGSCAIIIGGMELALFFIPEAYRMGIGFVILILAIVLRRVLER